SAPTLDVRDVENEYCHRQNGGYPDESRIRGLIHDDSCTYKSCAKPRTGDLISELPARKRSLTLELFEHAHRQQNPRLFHAPTVFETDQPVGNRILPDRQMRAAPPPSLCVGIAARRLRDPGKKLLCQCVRGVLHG